MKKTLLTLLLSGAAAVSVSATTVIDYAVANVAGSGAATSVNGTAFSTSTLLSQTMAPGFEGQGTLFGGTGSTISSPLQIRGASQGFRTAQIFATSSINNALNALFMWDQSNFLNGGDAATVSLGAGNSISLVSDGTLNDSGASWGYKFVVRDSGVYYISDTSAIGDLTISDFTNSTWAVFDPTASSGNVDTIATTIAGFTAGDYTTRTFNNVTAVGVYVSTLSTFGGLTMGITDFDVDATIIPEISTLSYAAAGLLTMLVCLRRRRK